MMNPYLKFVESIQTGIEQVKGLSASGKTEPVQSSSKVLLFSPHPDDECITGLLPLRLMREAGMQVINIPVTFGSNVDRQAERAEELKNACAYLGFQCLEKTAGRNAAAFHSLGKPDVIELLNTTRPRIVFIPHSKDWNSRHIATHHLVMNAFNEMPKDFSCTVVETEFWGAMGDPNLMVEGDVQTVADLVAALSLHVKEVERNPYHLSLPAWMQDNVRRGGELVGGQGGRAPEFTFATLYRLSRWENGKLFKCLGVNRILSMTDELKEIL
jgi:LmbE family N-acetylglucosaminyl deacetylase